MRQTVGIHQAPELQQRLRSWLIGGSHPQPVLWLKFGEKKGSTCYDSSKNSNNATIKGGTWITGVIDNGIQLDGTDDWLEIADSSTLRGMSYLTIMAWLYWDTPSMGNWIDSRYTGSSEQYEVRWHDGGYMRFGLKTVNGHVNHDATWTPIKETWYHVVNVYNGSVMKSYVNAVQIGTTSAQTGAVNDVAGTLDIGRREAGLAPYFKGKIDELRIYDVALTLREITRAYKGVF